MALQQEPTLTSQYIPGPVNPEHLPWLDGLRGIAALWVLLSHVQILTGLTPIPVLSWGGLAVDLFITLSGFLMAHHYIQRRDAEPWDASRTFLIFWLRRFFRIAPLYYLLMVIALLIGPWLGEFRTLIAEVWPQTATLSARYNDQSAINFLTHVSFLFGFLPYFSFRTPLPDWSIGLEMQFYLAFPFIMLLMARMGAILSSFVIVSACLLAKHLFPDFFNAFEMPSFLPIKLYLFMVGIWIAVSRSQRSMQPGLIVAILLSSLWVVIEKTDVAVARVIMVGMLFYLMDNGTMPGSAKLLPIVHRLRIWLSTPFSRFLGDSSYATYLLHLLILLPIAGLLTQIPAYQALNAVTRFVLCVSLCIPGTYALSWGLYHFVEKKGIRVGKQVIKSLKLSAH